MALRLTRIAALCVILVLIALPVRAAWWWPFGNDGIDYKIDISGIDASTRDWIKSLKLDEKNKANPPKNRTELAQEAASLAERLRKALEAKGFYDAVIQQRIADEKETPVLRYAVTPGQRYHIAAIRLDWKGKAVRSLAKAVLQTKEKAGVDVGLIQQDAVTLLTLIGKDACLLSLQVVPLLELDGSTHQAKLIFRIDHGPKANFGPVIIRGTKDVQNKVILRAVKWKQGECFNQDKIEQTRTLLIQNQLLSSVKVTPAPVPDKDGQSPVYIDVKERVPRTITAGASYATDVGFGVTTGWEHRNYFGGGEKLNSDLTLAEQEQSLLNKLRIPAFRRDDQVLALNLGIKREDQDAYQSLTFETGATVERKLSQRLNSGLGIAYTLTQTDDVLAGKSNYGLISLPGFLEYDTRNNTQDTRKGWLARLAVTPYTETFGTGGQFLKTQATAQTYFSSETSFKPTLALKAMVGSIAGAEGTEVPSDIRFYAGGGGSVRGYSYQSLSPRLNGEPIGGSSVLATSSEIRLRFTDTIGGVAFVDAGNAYDTPFPGSGGKIYYGAGVGARYYSAVGPLRLDVAVPLNGQDIGETGFAVYVSLGQAF